MKKSGRSFFLGFLTAAILLGLAIPAIAAGGTVTWDSVFVGEKIVIDGATHQPKDENGSPVDAVAHDGVAYIPVSVIADVFGAEVNWDQDAHTIQIFRGSKAPAQPEPEDEPEPAAAVEDYTGVYKVYRIQGQTVDEFIDEFIEEYVNAYLNELIAVYADSLEEGMDLGAYMTALREEIAAELRAEIQNMMTLELREDGTCVMRYEEDAMELNWAVEGETLILSVDGEAIELGYKDGVVILDMDGETLELKR